MFAPPWSDADHYLSDLKARGLAVLDAAMVSRLAGVQASGLAALGLDWERLEPDLYLRDGGHYRRRRHASFVLDRAGLRNVPYRAHWQPREYNALHGGMRRVFTPIAESTLQHPGWRTLLGWLQRVADDVHGAQPWFAEAHQFRVDTTGGIGRPTPEGAHRDGVDLVAVFLMARRGIKGGETRVFELDGPRGQRFTLEQPWSVLLLDDSRVIHETTPIQPLETGRLGHRDTLVVALRRDGFMEPP